MRKKLNYDRIIYNLVAPHMNGQKILSIGCGEGSVESLIQKNLNVKITGVEVTKYREQKIETEIYDGKTLPFRGKSFDTSLFVYVLHHSENIESLLSEAKRVSRGNILILDHIYTSWIDRFLLKAFDYFVNIPYKIPLPFNFLKIKEWESVFKKLGLAVEEASVPSSMNVFFKLRC